MARGHAGRRLAHAHSVGHRVKPSCVNMFEVRLLPTAVAPQEFKVLRPISLLCTSCKSFPRTLPHKAELCDACTHGTCRAYRAFGRRFVCAGLILMLRTLTDKTTGWRIPMCPADRFREGVRQPPIWSHTAAHIATRGPHANRRDISAKCERAQFLVLWTTAGEHNRSIRALGSGRVEFLEPTCLRIRHGGRSRLQRAQSGDAAALV